MEKLGTTSDKIGAYTRFVVRRVSVNRDRAQKEAIEAAGHELTTELRVLERMPKGEGSEVVLVFFKPDLSQCGGLISHEALESMFECCGLKSADPISVAAMNESDPTFVEERPHAVQWKDGEVGWCYAAFDRCWEPGHVGVYVDFSNEDQWGDRWWFVGVPK